MSWLSKACSSWSVTRCDIPSWPKRSRIMGTLYPCIQKLSNETNNNVTLSITPSAVYSFFSSTRNYQTSIDEDSVNVTRRQVQSSYSPPRRNLALQAVKLAGLHQLEESAQMIAKKAGQSLLLSVTEEIDSTKPNLKQLRMATTLLDVMEDIMELYCAKVSELCIMGEPVEVTDVEVSPDLGYARIYWTLPVTMEDKPLTQVRSATEHIQRLLDEKHGKQIQHLVAGKLRKFRYVPKLRFVPGDTDLTHSDIVLNSRPRMR